MLSRNNKLEKEKKIVNSKNRFSIRKLTIGAASVLIGTAFWMGATNVTVHADAAAGAPVENENGGVDDQLLMLA